MMNLLTALILSAFCLLSVLASQAEGASLDIFPKGKEVTYGYSAVVTTGTELPAPFVSQFRLIGNLKVQSLHNRASVQLLNLKYSMYSGDDYTEHSDKMQMVELQSDAATLSEPFNIHYTNGKVSKLTLSFGEPTWSKSVKQALASLLQLDLQNIDFKKHISFESTEQSIHGECLVSYTMKPQQGNDTQSAADFIQITKRQNIKDCQSTPVIWSNIEYDCPEGNPQQYNLLSTSQKKYKVKRYGDNSIVIDEVQSMGETHNFPKMDSENKHSITVSQKLTLESVNDILQYLTISNATEVNSLQYDETEFYSFKFSTDEDLTHVVPKVLQLHSLIVHQLQSQNQLLSDEPNAHLVPLLITYLRKLDVALLETVFKTIKNKNSTSSEEIFLKTLPLVGSRDSSVFILNVLKKKQVTDDVAFSLLLSLPVNLRQMSEDLLHELEGLNNLGADVSDFVKDSAVLSFATLLYKTCRFNKCKQETVDKYVHQYLQHITDSDSFKEQQLYLAALQNIKTEKIWEYLKSTISGAENIRSEHLEVLALKAVFPAIKNDPEQVEKVYWPILSSPNNRLELRALALQLLMKCNPTSSLLFRLHWFMVNERCHHLYNIYYTLLKGFAETSDIACYCSRIETARQILKATRKPIVTIFSSSYYKFDLSEGEELLVLSVGNPKTGGVGSLDMTYTSRSTGYSVDYYSIYIKAKGVKDEFLEYFIKAFALPVKLAEALSSEDNSVPSLEPVHLEFILYFHDQVVATRYYDENNILKFFEDMRSLLTLKNGLKLYFHHVTSSLNLEKFFVTDIGMPGVLSADFPSLFSLRIETSQDLSGPISVDTSFDLRYWSQGSTVLKVKNTIASIWQGIIKSHVTRFNLPLGFGLKYHNLQDIQARGLNVSVTGNDYLGLKWHTKADIFTVTYSDDYDALNQSCPTCMSLTTISKQKKSTQTLSKTESEAYTSVTEAFDCEDNGNLDQVKSIQELFAKNNMSMRELITANPFLENLLLKLPIVGSCGITTVIIPSESIPLFKLCFVFKVDFLSLEDSKSERNLNLSYGCAETPSTDCRLEQLCIVTVIEEKQVQDEDGTQNVCMKDECETNNVETEREVSKPQIFTCSQSERISINRIRISLKLKQLPTGLQENILSLMKAVLSLHEEIRLESLPELKTELVFHSSQNTYSVNLNFQSHNVTIKNIMFNIHPDTLKLFKRLYSYLKKCS